MQQYLTDRKRAEGAGSGRNGTTHHWQMMGSSLALLITIPAFMITFGIGLAQGSAADVTAFFSSPLPAIVMALTMISIVLHCMNEALEAIEDYVHGTRGKLMQMAVTWGSYIVIAVGLFALGRMAL